VLIFEQFIMMNKSIKALCLAGLSFLIFSFAQSQISSNLSFSLTSGPFLPVAERLSYKGYGESQIINGCIDGVT
jgi:hypothetical protein